MKEEAIEALEQVRDELRLRGASGPRPRVNTRCRRGGRVRPHLAALRFLVLPTIAFVVVAARSRDEPASRSASTRSSLRRRHSSSRCSRFGAHIRRSSRSARCGASSRSDGPPSSLARHRARGGAGRRGLVRPPSSTRAAAALIAVAACSSRGDGSRSSASPRPRATSSARARGRSSDPTHRARRPARARDPGGRARLGRRLRWSDLVDGARHSVHEVSGHVLDEVEKAVVGKREPLELVLLGFLADGHVLLEDYPGPREDARRAVVRAGPRAWSSRASSSRRT